MAFRIPNEADAPFLDQSKIDAVDTDILLAGYLLYGVNTGLTVTQRAAGANMSVDVAAGATVHAGITVTATNPGNFAIGAAHAVHARFDLIVVSNVGTISVVAGTDSTIETATGNTNAVFPTYTSTSVVLAAVYVAAAATSITTASHIQDRRVFLTNLYSYNADPAFDSVGVGPTGIRMFSDAGITSKGHWSGSTGHLLIGDGSASAIVGLEVGDDYTSNSQPYGIWVDQDITSTVPHGNGGSGIEITSGFIFDVDGTWSGPYVGLNSDLFIEDNASAVTISEVIGVRAAFTITSPSLTVTTGRLLYVPAISTTGAVGTLYGLDIEAQTAGTLNVGIRNAGTSRLVGAVTIGADAAVTLGQIASITGNVGISAYLRAGSLTAPTNNTAGDITGIRLIVPDAPIVHSAVSLLGGPVVIPDAGKVRFSDAGNSDYISLGAPALTDTSDILLPPNIPSIGDVIDVSAVSDPTITTRWRSGEMEVTITVETPSATDNHVVRQFQRAVTITAISATVIGGTSVTIDPEHGTTVTTATKLLSAAESVASSNASGEYIGGAATGAAMAATFNDVTLAAGDYLRLTITAQVGDPTQLSVTFLYRYT